MRSGRAAHRRRVRRRLFVGGAGVLAVVAALSTIVAVNGVPLENVTPLRMSNVHSVGEVWRQPVDSSG